MQPVSIKYIPRADINTQQWNACIRSSSNGVIYALDFYLDHMAVNWDALVLNDYDAVMPLTWNKKYGIYYLYQPFLCASLGVFGNNITAEIIKDFLNAIPKRFKFWDIYLNSGNDFEIAGYEFQTRLNHELDLSPGYEILHATYRNSYRQLLKRFYLSKHEVSRNVPISEVILLAKEQLNPLFNVREEDYQRFEKLYTKLEQAGRARAYGVYGANRQLLASGCFLYDMNRVYYVLAGNHPNGRTLGASHAMLDAFISDHSGKNLILDFEGSDVSRIAFFFRGFGAVHFRYPGLKLNRLPWYLRLLKK